MFNTITKAIEHEQTRQQHTVELIPSENYFSKEVAEAVTSTCLMNKYSEGYPGSRYYPGCENIDVIETLAIKNAQKLFDVDYANVQPHSGTISNAAVFLSVLRDNGKILSLKLDCGGHISHGSKISFSGKVFNSAHYEVDRKSELVDLDAVEERAVKEQPDLIICGASSYSRDWDYSRFRKIADRVGAILLADISHTAGLISSKLLNDPFNHCHIITATTNKTLRGPRGGLILIKKDFDFKGKSIQNIIQNSVFPGLQTGAYNNFLAGKAIALMEAQKTRFIHYSKQVIKNSKRLAESFLKRGFNIVSNGTDNHLFVLKLDNCKITGDIASSVLSKVNILANKNLIPFDKETALKTSAIRIGTPAITTRGFKEDEMAPLADWISNALYNHNNTRILNGIKRQVIEYCDDKPMFHIY